MAALLLGGYAGVRAVVKNVFDGDGRPTYGRFEAYSVCKTFVSKRLKAPSTAKFASMHESRVDSAGSGLYRVAGYVDAENSFGAKLRRAYRCEVVADTARQGWHQLGIELIGEE